MEKTVIIKQSTVDKEKKTSIEYVEDKRSSRSIEGRKQHKKKN